MNILVFGAGRSAFFTIQYLLQKSLEKNWQITVADFAMENIELCTQGFTNAKAKIVNVQDDTERTELIKDQDIVISLLPARFHILVAQDCLHIGIHLITPSYLTPEIQAMHDEASQKGLFFINELGLDPGIDHMSAMQIVDDLHNKGAEITSFKSYCGGLIARENDTNPWHYKFSWNPYNVIRAGSDGALCRVNGSHKYIPYNRLFAETETFTIGEENFDGYYNRNSERYIDLYKLHKAQTFVRGTLRYEGYCQNWNTLVNLGLTHDSIELETKNISWQDYFKIFFPKDENRFPYMASEKNASGEIKWLWENNSVPVPAKATPAHALQTLLEEKWQMEKADKDRVVMIHEFIYTLGAKCFSLQSWLDINGEDNLRTAMAKTVGLPLAMTAELIADNKLKTTGVIMPTSKEIYEPLMQQLNEYGIIFHA